MRTSFKGKMLLSPSLSMIYLFEADSTTDQSKTYKLLDRETNIQIMTLFLIYTSNIYRYIHMHRTLWNSNFFLHKKKMREKIDKEETN